MRFDSSANAREGVAGLSRSRQLVCHAILLIGMVFMLGPIVLIATSSTHATATLQLEGLQWLPGSEALNNYSSILSLQSGFFSQATLPSMLFNSLIVAVGVGVLTTIISWSVAAALVFFRWPWAHTVFWITFVTLLFPLESRFVNTFPVIVQLGLIYTHAGIILPVVPVALATLFFRQYFLSLPKELMEASLLDGAGPFRFMRDMILPLSVARAGAVFVIAFIVGWNQYLWPTMISTDDSMYTLVRGIRFVGQESGPGMAFVMISILPPLVLVLLLHKQLYKAFSLFD